MRDEKWEGGLTASFFLLALCRTSPSFVPFRVVSVFRGLPFLEPRNTLTTRKDTKKKSLIYHFSSPTFLTISYTKLIGSPTTFQ
jgi:hypothetical protein